MVPRQISMELFHYVTVGETLVITYIGFETQELTLKWNCCGTFFCTNRNQMKLWLLLV